MERDEEGGRRRKNRKRRGVGREEGGVRDMEITGIQKLLCSFKNIARNMNHMLLIACSPLSVKRDRKASGQLCYC